MPGEPTRITIVFRRLFLAVMERSEHALQRKLKFRQKIPDNTNISFHRYHFGPIAPLFGLEGLACENKWTSIRALTRLFSRAKTLFLA